VCVLQLIDLLADKVHELGSLSGNTCTAWHSIAQHGAGQHMKSTLATGLKTEFGDVHDRN
jgi:hypothetical protein